MPLYLPVEYRYMSTAALSHFSVELLSKQARQIEAFLSAWLWSLTHPRLASYQ